LNPDIFGDVILRASDLSVLIDEAGLILEVIFDPENTNFGRLEHWRTRNLRDFMTSDSIEKFDSQMDVLLINTNEENLKPFQLNHFNANGNDFPIQYTAHPTGVKNQILLFGKDLTQMAKAQQELMKTQLKFEKEYDRYRSFDTKYRVILEECGVPFILVNSEKIVLDHNKKAANFFSAIDLREQNIDDLFEVDDNTNILEELQRSRNQSPGKHLNLRIRQLNKVVEVSGTFFRSSEGLQVLLRISEKTDDNKTVDVIKPYLSKLYKKSSDSFVFIDDIGRIVEANESFLTLCEAPTQDQIIGTMLSKFFKNSETDVRVLTDSAKKFGKIRNYSTEFITLFGSTVLVTISSTWILHNNDNHFGFILRDMSNVRSEKENEKHNWDYTSKLVGTAPLKTLVAQTGDIAERICLETALRLTNNNKVAAAEMLSLSRQSLYVKLRKYDLVDSKE
jgi:transcriptional regulator PpsR